MTEREVSDLIKSVCNDPATLLAALRSVCCQASTASKMEDSDKIFDSICHSVGFAQLDSMVTSKMIEAVCVELRRQPNDTSRSTAYPALHALAQLRGLQGNFVEAEQLHRECIKNLGSAHHAPNSPELISSVGIAIACARQGKGQEARKFYRSVLQATSRQPLAARKWCDLIRLEAASGLALECHPVAKLRVKADNLAEKWVSESALKKCGAALYNFGMLRLAQDRTMDAEVLFRSAVDALRLQAGEFSPLLPWNPKTLEAWAAVATALEIQGRQAEATECLRTILALRERFLGVENVDTVTTSLTPCKAGQEIQCCKLWGESSAGGEK